MEETEGIDKTDRMDKIEVNENQESQGCLQNGNETEQEVQHTTT